MLRGLTRKQEQDPGHLIRDTRTIGMRMRDFLTDAASVTVVMVTLATTAFLVPGLIDVVLILALILFLFNVTRKHALPFRMPQRCGALDYNDLKPGSRKPNKARGICFFGNEQGTNEELWFNNDDMRTHALIFGSTGSGKTVTLTSIAYNALVQGSGFIYVDGKGDNTLFSNIFSMVRSVGREDDILLINFMTGARDIIGPQEKRLSNTLNPFAQGSSSMLSQLIASLMDGSGQSSDGDMWKGRAIAFIESLMKILVYARDKDVKDYPKEILIGLLLAYVQFEPYLTLSLGLPESYSEKVKEILASYDVRYRLTIDGDKRYFLMKNFFNKKSCIEFTLDEGHRKSEQTVARIQAAFFRQMKEAAPDIYPEQAHLKAEVLLLPVVLQCLMTNADDRLELISRELPFLESEVNSQGVSDDLSDELLVGCLLAYAHYKSNLKLSLKMPKRYLSRLDEVVSSFGGIFKIEGNEKMLKDFFYDQVDLEEQQDNEVLFFVKGVVRPTWQYHLKEIKDKSEFQNYLRGSCSLVKWFEVPGNSICLNNASEDVQVFFLNTDHNPDNQVSIIYPRNTLKATWYKAERIANHLLQQQDPKLTSFSPKQTQVLIPTIADAQSKYDLSERYKCYLSKLTPTPKNDESIKVELTYTFDLNHKGNETKKVSEYVVPEKPCFGCQLFLEHPFIMNVKGQTFLVTHANDQLILNEKIVKAKLAEPEVKVHSTLLRKLDVDNEPIKLELNSQDNYVSVNPDHNISFEDLEQKKPNPIVQHKNYVFGLAALFAMIGGALLLAGLLVPGFAATPIIGKAAGILANSVSSTWGLGAIWGPIAAILEGTGIVLACALFGGAIGLGIGMLVAKFSKPKLNLSARNSVFTELLSSSDSTVVAQKVELGPNQDAHFSATQSSYYVSYSRVSEARANQYDNINLVIDGRVDMTLFTHLNAVF